MQNVNVPFFLRAENNARSSARISTGLAQIDELIDLYKDEEYVVMMGDWNAYHKFYYDPFADAGYSLGNYGEILTCNGSRTGGLEWAVDDIVVKGLTLSDFRAVNTGLSDHIAVVATLTLPNP